MKLCRKYCLQVNKRTALSPNWVRFCNSHFIFSVIFKHVHTVSLPLRRHTLFHNSVLGAFLTFLSGSIATRWAQLSAQLRMHHCFNFPYNAESFWGAWRLRLGGELKVHSGWKIAIEASLVHHLNFIALTWQTWKKWIQNKYFAYLTSNN